MTCSASPSRVLRIPPFRMCFSEIFLYDDSGAVTGPLKVTLHRHGAAMASEVGLGWHAPVTPCPEEPLSPGRPRSPLSPLSPPWELQSRPSRPRSGGAPRRY